MRVLPFASHARPRAARCKKRAHPSASGRIPGFGRPPGGDACLGPAHRLRDRIGKTDAAPAEKARFRVKTLSLARRPIRGPRGGRVDGTVAAMCGRFTLTTRREVLARAFALDEVQELAPRWNAAPGQDVATIQQSPEGRRQLRLRRWGLVPFFAPDPRIGSRLINARAETAAVRPAFREAFRLRRCAVPADGFYGWAAEAGSRRRQPYYIALPDRAPFAIAGLFERWRAEDGTWLESCALLTVAANERVRPLHDRMPAILAAGDLEAWLDPALREPARLRELLAPFAGAELELRRVGDRVNRPEHDDPGCIAAPEPGADRDGARQLTLGEPFGG